MPAARGATARLLRELREAAPAGRLRRRAGRFPPPLEPAAVAASYLAALRREVLAPARAALKAELPELVRLLKRAAGEHPGEPTEPQRMDAAPRGRSGRLKQPARVSLVVALDPDGRLLLGRQRDTGRWTLAGGHHQPGERPLRAAARELEEETDLVGRDWELLETQTNPDGTEVWVYGARVRGTPTGHWDPDQECGEWRFVDVRCGLSPEIAAALAGPEDARHNVLLRRFPTRLPLPNLEPLGAVFQAVCARAGMPRDAPALVAQPSLGVVVAPDVRGAAALYDPERDTVTFGAEVLALLTDLFGAPDATPRVLTDRHVLALKVVVHEALHAAVGDATRGAAPDHDATVALVVVEEASAEMAAELLVGEVAHGFARDAVSREALLRAEAPLLRLTEQGDVHLLRPSSYPTWTERLAQVVYSARPRDLLGWLLELRAQRGAGRLAWLAEATGTRLEDVVGWLGGEPTPTPRFPSVRRRPPRWLATSATPRAAHEMTAELRERLLAAERRLRDPAASDAERAAAVRDVDQAGDAWASFHARTALEQGERLRGLRLDADPERAARAKAGVAGSELRRASAQGEQAARLLERAAREFAGTLDPVALREVVSQFGQRTDKLARQQLDQQLRSAIGVSLPALGVDVPARLDEWAARNVDLIVTVPERYFDRLRLDVLEAFEEGAHVDELMERLEERYDVSERDAERIARDQTLKLSADLTHDRMERLGVSRATWRTVRDARVCEDCDAMEGVEFELADGAEGPCGPGTRPGDCHPVDRCWSEPDLGPLLGSELS